MPELDAPDHVHEEVGGLVDAHEQVRQCDGRLQGRMYSQSSSMPQKKTTLRLLMTFTFEIIIWTRKRGVSNQIILCRWREMDKFLCEIVIILQLAAFNRHISEENISNSVSLSKRPKAAVGLSPGTPVMPLK